MAMIETVAGPVDDRELGVVLCREHLATTSESVRAQFSRSCRSTSTTASPARSPNWHFAFLWEGVLPALREGGVTDAQITTMLEDNPRRWLAA